MLGDADWRFVPPSQRAGTGHLAGYDPATAPKVVDPDHIKEAANDYYDEYWQDYWQRLRDKYAPCALVQQTDAAADPRPVPVAALKTFGTSGKAVYPFTEGDKTEAELFRHEGKGCLTHMWFGGKWPDYERLRIRVYVDGEQTASIDMELFLGHGIGFKDDFGPWGTKRIGKTGQPSGIYNTYRIPFGRSVRVTAQLHEGDTGNKRFWYIIRGVENLPVEFSGVRLPAEARLKLYKREDYTAQTLEEVDLCNTNRPGMLYQVTIAAQGERLNFLASCVRAYIDGSKEPLLASSGLEDYFLGTYFFNRGKYHNEVAGLTHLNQDDHSFSAYRFHEEDPIFFKKGLRLTVKCGEQIEGQRHNPRLQTWKAPPTTYTTYVWIYEW